MAAPGLSRKVCSPLGPLWRKRRREVFDMQKGCRECGIPFCVLKECIVPASIARSCPFVLQENCPWKCVAQFSVTVMVPILVLSAVVLPNAPFRDREVVALGAASTVVPTALSRLSDALSKVPVMPSKPVSAA